MSHFTSDFSYLPIWIIFTFPEVVRKIKIPPLSAIHPVTHVSINWCYQNCACIKTLWAIFFNKLLLSACATLCSRGLLYTSQSIVSITVMCIIETPLNASFSICPRQLSFSPLPPPTVGSFSIDNGNGSKHVTFKMNSHFANFVTLIPIRWKCQM